MPRRRVRIVGGTAGGRELAPAARAPAFRPTTAKVREALFNILGNLVDGARFADLYAGTGAVGLEALSRGARHAWFVERSAPLAAAISRNAERLGFAGHATIVTGKLPDALAGIAEPIDIVFMDPPYADPSAEATLDACHRLLAPGGIVVYEHASRYNPPERPTGLRLGDRRIYGDSAVALYSTTEGE